MGVAAGGDSGEARLKRRLLNASDASSRARGSRTATHQFQASSVSANTADPDAPWGTWTGTAPVAGLGSSERVSGANDGVGYARPPRAAPSQPEAARCSCLKRRDREGA